jgi:hypothetical protein
MPSMCLSPKPSARNVARRASSEIVSARIARLSAWVRIWATWMRLRSSGPWTAWISRPVCRASRHKRASSVRVTPKRWRADGEWGWRADHPDRQAPWVAAGRPVFSPSAAVSASAASGVARSTRSAGSFYTRHAAAGASAPDSRPDGSGASWAAVLAARRMPAPMPPAASAGRWCRTGGSLQPRASRSRAPSPTAAARNGISG